jgi:hypothetical protein
MAFGGKKWLAALLEEDLSHTLHFSHYECGLWCVILVGDKLNSAEGCSGHVHQFQIDFCEIIFSVKETIY